MPEKADPVTGRKENRENSSPKSHPPGLQGLHPPAPKRASPEPSLKPALEDGGVGQTFSLAQPSRCPRLGKRPLSLGPAKPQREQRGPPGGLLGKLRHGPLLLLCSQAFLPGCIPVSWETSLCKCKQSKQSLPVSSSAPSGHRCPTPSSQGCSGGPPLANREKVTDRSKNREGAGAAGMNSLVRRPNQTHEKVQGSGESQDPSWRARARWGPGEHRVGTSRPLSWAAAHAPGGR